MTKKIAAMVVTALAAVTVAAAAGYLWWHGQFPELAGVFGGKTRIFLGKTVFYVGDQPVRVFFLIKTLLLLFVLGLTARIARRKVSRFLEDNPRISANQKYLFSKGITVAVYGIGIAFGIWAEGIDSTALAVVGGTAAVILGLGLQGLVSSFVAGLVLLFEQSVRVGDRVEFDGKIGEVVHVGLRSSSIRTDDNVLIVISNAEFIGKQLLNYSPGEGKLRVVASVPVGYGANQEEVIEHLLVVGNNHRDVLQSPAPSVVLSELGPRAQVFALRVWTGIPAKDILLLRSDLHLAIVKRFKDHNIEMPVAQLELYLKQAGPVASSAQSCDFSSEPASEIEERRQ